KKSCPAL
ncbi:hypothetical protein SLEP1_g60212, partial [Rubroshorea leprosula]